MKTLAFYFQLIYLILIIAGAFLPSGNYQKQHFKIDEYKVEV
jgi:hypothetical protein